MTRYTEKEHKRIWVLLGWRYYVSRHTILVKDSEIHVYFARFRWRKPVDTIKAFKCKQLAHQYCLEKNEPPVQDLSNVWHKDLGTKSYA